MSHAVFISYSSKDRDAACRVCSFLERRDVACWIAPRDVPPGGDYAEEILAAIENADAVVLLLSANANLSRHVRNEVDRAVSNGKAIFPVRIEDVTPSKALELLLSARQWIDAHVPPLEQRLERLEQAINSILEKSREPSPVPSDRPLDGKTQAGRGIITGNRVFLRAGPTVAAKSVGMLNQGDEVQVLAQSTVEASRECQLKDDLTCVREKGKPYRLRAGRGLVISGETATHYRVEIVRPRGTDIGHIPKDAVIPLEPGAWLKVRTASVEGWVFSRYVRVF